jgi:RNA polymerase sigma-70 factor (ECF subfamily)
MTNDKTHTDPFSTLHTRFKKVVEGYAFYLTGSRQHIEDISQEIFMRIWLKWPQFSQMEQGRLEGYIYAMVKNEVINRSRKTISQRKYITYYKAICSDTYWHDDVLLNDGLKIYRAAVDSLPPKERRVYRFYAVNYDRFQIAAIENCSENTIRNQLHSASKTVKAFLNKNFDLNISADGRRKFWKGTSLN